MQGRTHGATKALPSAVRIPFWSAGEEAVWRPLSSRPGRGGALPGAPVARPGAVPEENPEAASALHQTGANALPEGVSGPHHQAVAQGDRVGGAEVLASENPAAEDAGRRRRGRTELEEPRSAPPAFVPTGGCSRRQAGTSIRHCSALLTGLWQRGSAARSRRDSGPVVRGGGRRDREPGVAQRSAAPPGG